MDIAEIKRRIEDVKSLAGDPAAAHLAEDKLLGDVLRAIAGGADNPAVLAFIALDVRKVSFDRWYA